MLFIFKRKIFLMSPTISLGKRAHTCPSLELGTKLAQNSSSLKAHRHFDESNDVRGWERVRADGDCYCYETNRQNATVEIGGSWFGVFLFFFRLGAKIEFTIIPFGGVRIKRRINFSGVFGCNLLHFLLFWFCF